MSGEWRIAAEDRRKYENYFQQCGPDQGFVTGERARAFFLQSKLPEDILRKIWDLADLNHDGRLDKREFAIACHLIRSQVSKLAPMPSTLPPTLLADAMLINSNGSSFPPPPPQTPLPFSLTPTLSLNKPPANTFFPLTPNVRSKYLQQFHSIVDVSKSHGYMSASQAKNLLEQKHLSQTILRQVWDLADADKDGRLTADEFVIAMHCCDVVQAGGTLPKRLPDEWSHTKIMQRERIGSIHLDDESSASNSVQRKNSDFSFEDKRKANYLNGEKELERRREFLREQEERERREREEREKKRQFDLEKQKEEQERQRRLEIERQLERQRQIEQQKEEERKKMLEQREAARREMERKSRLEWERQRMQELSIQKTRLLEQITDFKSREKALDLEIQTMEENISTSRRKIDQSNGNVQTIDQSIADLQKKTNEERNNYQTLEQQRKDLLVKFKRVQNERETIESSYRQMSQSKDFNLDRQENEQMRVIQSQIQSIKQETAQTDQQIQQFTQLYQSYQRQLEQFRSQLAQFEQDVKRKSPAKTVTFSPQTSIAPSPAPAPAPAVARPTAIVDPFQTVDPFAFPSDVVSSPSSTKRRAPTIPNEKFVQYRALYDHSPLRDDELAIRTGDVIQVNPSAQQGTDWLFGKLSNGQEGYFPANYAERVEEKETKNNRQSNGTQYDTTSTLTPGSWVIAIADCQGKTADKHLSFQQGDCILVQTQHDQSWYSGQLNGKVGWFPRNYVRPANEQEIPSKTNTNDSTNSANGSSGVVWRERSALPTIPEVYVAIHPYQAIEPSDLSFDVGERITVLERDGDWWLGRIGQRSGTFPRNYVEKVETPLLETAVAIAPFHSTDEGRLSFDLGQLIYIRKKGDKGWYQGELRIPDQPIQVGWFPANCVQIQSAGSAATRTTSMNSSSTPSYLNTTNYPRYIALFPYTAQQNDELSFPADAIFEVLDVTEDNNWFTARYNNQVGLIPATYVQPYQSSSSNLVSTPRIARQPPTLSAPDSSSINTTLSDADTSLSMCSNPSRISAIRELIETEQRYIDDLEIVHHDVIETLKQVHLLSEHESKEIFLNWKNLIDRNEILLNALKDQVDYKDPPSMQRNNRSASMSNIALAALPTHSAEILMTKRLSHAVDSHHRSFTPDVAQSSPHRRLKHRSGKHQRSPSNVALAALPAVSLDTSGTSMTINDATQIGQILCEHLPNMEDDYLHYCSARAQANRILQSKIDNSEKFRSLLNIFQERTGGLSLNGFLTKPIQRVTRYPLLIEKILKHTPTDHPDHPFVKQALEIARKINEQINQQISEQESQTRLDWLQQHLIFGSDDNNADGYIFDELLKFNSLTKYNVPRQLILHGFVIKVPGGKELLAFLFNDFLLFATMKSSSSNWQTQIFEAKSNLQLKLYKMPILLSDIIIANDVLNDQFSFSITTKIYEKAVILKTLQTNVRTLWVKSINNAVEEYQAAERSVLSDRAMFTIPDAKRDTRSALARLLLVVQEAQDLMPSRNTLDRHRSVDPYCEITVGSLTLRTPFIKRTINPKWNAPMQFLIYNFHEEILHIHVFDHEFFSPNESLGSTSINLVDILPYPLETFLTQPSLPFTQKIYLNNGASVIIKFVIQFLQNSQ